VREEGKEGSLCPLTSFLSAQHQRGSTAGDGILSNAAELV